MQIENEEIEGFLGTPRSSFFCMYADIALPEERNE
jgi:hypothetical protein